MPRMLRPSPGEAADRQTILKLKLQYASAGTSSQTNMTEHHVTDQEGAVYRVARRTISDIPAVNIQPFVDENEGIQKYLEKNFLFQLNNEQGEKYDSLFDELAEVNHAIWKLTNQGHILREAPDRAQAQANVRAAEVLYATIELNDKRASLVSQINELFGVRVTEKIFA